MGNQVRFFMTNKDEITFFKHLENMQKSILSDKGSVMTIEEVFNSKDMLFFIASKESNIIKKTNGYIDTLKSDTIEYSRCITKENNLTYGRVWAEFKYYNEDGSCIVKDKKFKEDFNAYKKWISTNFKISKCRYFHIGDDAYKNYKEHGWNMLATPVTKVEF